MNLKNEKNRLDEIFSIFNTNGSVLNWELDGEKGHYQPIIDEFIVSRLYPVGKRFDFHLLIKHIGYNGFTNSCAKTIKISDLKQKDGGLELIGIMGETAQYKLNIELIIDGMEKERWKEWKKHKSKRKEEYKNMDKYIYGIHFARVYEDQIKKISLEAITNYILSKNYTNEQTEDYSVYFTPNKIDIPGRLYDCDIIVLPKKDKKKLHIKIGEGINILSLQEDKEHIDILDELLKESE